MTPPRKPRGGAPDPLAELRQHGLTLGHALRNHANAATVAAGKPSTSHLDRRALERVAASAADLSLLLTLFGRRT
jgi:hypothetical protein